MILSQMVKILKNGFLVKLFGKYKIISYNSFYHDMFVQVPSTLNSKEKSQKSHFKGTISMTTDFQKTTPLKFLFWVILFSRYQSGILLTFSRSPNKEYKTKKKYKYNITNWQWFFKIFDRNNFLISALHLFTMQF